MEKMTKLLLVTLLLISFSSTAFAMYDPNYQPVQSPEKEVSINLLNKSLKPEVSFLDVKNHQVINAINFVKKNGIMVGYPDNTFRPDKKVNRLELAVILDRVFDFNFRAITFIKQPELKDKFDDVYDGKWYSIPLVQTTFFNVLNTNDRMFKPNNVVTRIEVAKAIQQSFKAKNLSVVMTLMYPVFKDTKNLNSEESSALNFIVNTGIMKGNDDTFEPNKPVTRAELASILQRTMETLKVAEPIENRIIE